MPRTLSFADLDLICTKIGIDFLDMQLDPDAPIEAAAPILMTPILERLHERLSAIERVLAAIIKVDKRSVDHPLCTELGINLEPEPVEH